MAAKSGLFGSAVITIAGTVPGTANIVGIGEWSLDIGHGVVETTAFGDGWKQFIAGIKEYSGSFSGNSDTDSTHTSLRNAMLGGSVVGLRLYDTATTYYTVGTAYLSSGNPTISYDGKGEQGYDFQGVGALSYT